jgi:hypothetical protein
LEENKFRIRGDGPSLKQQYFKIGIQKNIYAAQSHVHKKFESPRPSLNGENTLPHERGRLLAV